MIMRSWGSEEVKYLEKHYCAGDPIDETAHYLCRSDSSIVNKAKALSLKRSYKYYKPKYNVNFFDQDNWGHELAYVTGLVTSDGHISKPPRKFVDLEMCDRDVIENVKILTEYRNKILSKWDGDINHSVSYYISFRGKKIWDFFINLGLDNSKSKTAVMPIIPDQYMWSFLRGELDGDGGIYVDRGTYYPRVEISGTKALIESIMDYIGFNGSFYSKFGNITWCARYSGKNAMQLLYKMYGDSNELTRMDRKYKKYLNILRNRR
jgi:hypothetical protein